METGGNGNRVAARDYLEFNFPQQIDVQPLVPAQRHQLNAQIRSAASTLREEPKQVWRHVHASLGVESVDEITRNQYLAAQQAVEDYLERGKQYSARQKLIGQILRMASEKNIQEPMESFCLGAFGMDRLKELDREDLAKVYGFVEGHPVDGDKSTNDKPHKPLHYLHVRLIWAGLISCFILGLLTGVAL